MFATFVIPNMFARAARGEVTPQQAVADAEAQIRPIFDKWRSRGPDRQRRELSRGDGRGP